MVSQLLSREKHAVQRRASERAEPIFVQQRAAERPNTIDDYGCSLGASSVQLSALDRALIQFREAASSRSADIHATAAEGMSGSASTLPHLDRIQRSFGRHDVSNVPAYADSKADAASRAMGAHAYASAGAVVLGQTGQDLHTVAHEAAHIVQQRSGVSLKGGVGQAGDDHERHADQVADLVVQGKSAESLLDRYAGGSSAVATKVVQRDATDTAEAEAEAEAKDSGAAVTTGAQVNISAGLTIPIAACPGLAVEVSIEGSYQTTEKDGSTYIEMEGGGGVSLAYDLGFAKVSVFARGNLKFKVKTESPQECLEKGFGEIAHWFAARELANLEQKKLEVAQAYVNFRSSLYALLERDLANLSDAERSDELAECESGLLFDNTIQNVVDARSYLIDSVIETFGDMEAEIEANLVFPSYEEFIKPFIDTLTDDQQVTSEELRSLIDLLNDTSLEVEQDVTSRMNAIAAIENDPDVEFEVNAQVGVSAGAGVNGELSGEVELGAGIRFSDSMGDTEFDTSAQEVYFASLNFESGMVKGGFSYEGIGDGPTNPSEFKVSGSINFELSESAPTLNEYQGTLESVRDELYVAQLNALVDGESMMAAVGEILSKHVHAKMEETPTQGVNGVSASFAVAVEVGMKKSDDGSWGFDAGQVKFMTLSTIEGDLKAVEGELKEADFISVSW